MVGGPDGTSQRNVRFEVKSRFFQEVTSSEELRAFPPSKLAVCFLHAVEEVTEELIPEKHKACGEGSL